MRDRDEREDRRGVARTPYSERRLAPSPSPPPSYSRGGYRDRNSFRPNFSNRNERYYRGRRGRPNQRNSLPTRVALGPDLHATRSGNLGPDLHARGAPSSDSYAYPQATQQDHFHPPADQLYSGGAPPNDRYSGPAHPPDRYQGAHPDRYGAPSQQDRYRPPSERYSGPPRAQQQLAADRPPMDHYGGQPPPHAQATRHPSDRYGPPMQAPNAGPPPDRYGAPASHSAPLMHTRPLPHGGPPVHRFVAQATPSHVPSNLVPLPAPKVSGGTVTPRTGARNGAQNGVGVKPANPAAPDPPSPCPVPPAPLTGEFRPATPPPNAVVGTPPPIESVQIPRRPPWQGQAQPAYQAPVPVPSPVPAVAPSIARPAPFPPLRSKPAPRKMPTTERAVVDLYIGGSQSAVLVERNGSMLFVGVTQIGATQRVACVGLPGCDVEILVGPNDATSKALLSCSRRIAKALANEHLHNVLVSVAIESGQSAQYEEIASSLEKLAAKQVLMCNR